jgi:hypothetical protein
MGFTQSVQLDNVEFPDVYSMVDHFTNVVVQAAAMNIPRSSIRPRRVPSPGGLMNVAMPTVPASAL